MSIDAQNKQSYFRSHRPFLQTNRVLVRFIVLPFSFIKPWSKLLARDVLSCYLMALMTLIFCSDPTCGGGGTIYSNGFFSVPWILADRYIHRREMCVVSLKSSTSVEFEIKKIFLNFVFFEELSRFKVSCEHWIFGSLLFTFTVIFVRINVFLLKFYNPMA